MAYGEKYRVEYNSRVYNNSLRVSILERDYEGAPVTFDSEEWTFDGSHPTFDTSDGIMRRESGLPVRLIRDHANVVCGTTLEFSMETTVDFEFADLYTEDPKKFFVQYYKNDVLHFEGYLNVESFTEPYIAPPYDIKFTATCGLGLLKEIPFTLSGRKTLMQIIMNCLSYLDFSRQFMVNIRTWEQNQGGSHSPLHQSYYNADNFIEKDCYQVLEQVIGIFDSQIKFRKYGIWEINRYPDKLRNYFVYNSSGTAIGSVGIAPAILQLGSHNADVYPIGALDREMYPASKLVTLKQDYGSKDNIIKAGDFYNYKTAGEIFKYWEWDGAPMPVDTRRGNAPGVTPNTRGGVGTNFVPLELMYITIGGQATTFSRYIKQIINNVQATTLDVVLNLDYAIVGNGRSGSPNRVGIIGVMIKLIGTINTYWLDQEDGWVGSETIIENPQVNEQGFRSVQFHKLSVIAAGMPEGGSIEVRLYNLKTTTYSDAWAASYAAFQQVKLGLFNTDGSNIPAGRELKIITNQLAGNSDPDHDFMLGDIPSFGSANLVYDYKLELSDETPTQFWYNDDDGAGILRPLIDQLAINLVSRRYRASRILRGTLQGANLDFENIIQHALDNNRRYYIHSANKNEYEDEMEVELHEFIPYEVDRTPPQPPFNLTAEASEDWIDLAWEHGGYNITTFRVYVRENGGDWTLEDLLSAEIRNYRFLTEDDDVIYDFYIVASNEFNSSNPSNIVTAILLQSGLSKPDDPTNLVATAISETEIELTWDDNSDDETGLKIERSPNGTDSWLQIGTVGENVELYNDTGLNPDTTYYYRVRAYNDDGNSGYSNTANATTNELSAPATPANLAGTQVSVRKAHFTWSESAGATGYKILWSVDNGLFKTVDTGGIREWTSPEQSVDSTVYAMVLAYNAGGESQWSNTESVYMI